MTWLGSRRARSAHVIVTGALAIGCATGALMRLERSARADEAPRPMPSRRVVEVLVAGGDGAGLDDTVRELLARLALITESQVVGHIDADEPSFRSTARPSLLARVGIDLRARDVALITIVDGRTGELAVRRSVRREGPPAVVREEVAHVVQSAVDPMLLAERDRAAAAAAAEPPPPPASPPSPPPQPATEPTTEPTAALPPAALPARDSAQDQGSAGSPLALDLATTAGAGSYGSGAGVVARAGGSAALVWRRGLRPSITIAAHYVFPFEAGPEVALAHVGVVTLRALPAIEIYGSPTFAIDVAAGGGMDVLNVEPRSNALPADRLGAASTRLDPIAAASVTGHLAIGGGSALSLLLGADVDLATRRWVVDSDSGRSSAFAPDRVRPLAMLGFTFTAVGEGRFGAPHEVPR